MEDNIGNYSKLEDILMVIGNEAILGITTYLFNINPYTGKYNYYMNKIGNTNNGREYITVRRQIETKMFIRSIKPINNTGDKLHLEISSGDLERFKIIEYSKLEKFITEFEDMYQLDKSTNNYSIKKGLEEQKILFKLVIPMGIKNSAKKIRTDNIIPAIELYLTENCVSLLSFTDFLKFISILKNTSLEWYSSNILNMINFPEMKIYTL